MKNTSFAALYIYTPVRYTIRTMRVVYSPSSALNCQKCQRGNIIRIVIISLSDMLAARLRRAMPFELRRGLFLISSSNFWLN